MKNLILILAILFAAINVCSAQIYRVLKGHTDNVYAAVFSPGGKFIASGGSDETIKIWDAESGRLIKSIDAKYRISKLYFDADAKNVFASTAPLTGISAVLDSFIVGYNVFSGDRIKSYDIQSKSPNFFVSKNGNTLVTILPELYLDSCKYTVDYNIENYMKPKCYKILLNEYDLSSEKRDSSIIIESLVNWEFNSPYVISDNGKYLAIYSKIDEPKSGFYLIRDNKKDISSNINKGIVYIFDIINKKLIKQIKLMDEALGQKTMLLTKNGSYLCYAAKEYMNDVINVLDIQKDEILFSLKGHTREILCMAMHPSGRYIASGGKDNSVRLWDIKTGNELKVFEGHTDDVNYVAFSSDGKFLISASNDNTVRVWDLSNASSYLDLYALKYDIQKGTERYLNEEKMLR